MRARTARSGTRTTGSSRPRVFTFRRLTSRGGWLFPGSVPTLGLPATPKLARPRSYPSRKGPGEILYRPRGPGVSVLFRQPHGFEGCRSISSEVRELDGRAVAERPHVPDKRLNVSAAHLAATAKAD